MNLNSEISSRVIREKFFRMLSGGTALPQFRHWGSLKTVESFDKDAITNAATDEHLALWLIEIAVFPWNRNYFFMPYFFGVPSLSETEFFHFSQLDFNELKPFI